MTTKTNKSKSTESSKSAAKSASKRARKPVAQLSAATKIAFESPRPKGAGNERKTKLLSLLPKKGTVTFKQLAAKATKALGVPEERINRWLVSMAHYGRVSLH